MNNDIIRLTTQLKLLYLKETGEKIDLLKFSQDESYAKKYLEAAAQSVNEELMVVALKLIELRPMKESAPQDTGGGDNKKPTDGGGKSKYVGKLR